MKVVLRDTLTTYWRGKMQYDRGQYLEIYNSGVYENNVIFQFIQNGEQRDILGELVNHEYYKVRIPDEFLKNEDEIKCFLYVESEEAAETKKIIIIDVMDREWYNSEPSEEEISLIGQLIDKVNDMQTQLENFELTEEQLENVLQQVLAAFSGEIYTKKQIDLKFLNLQNQVDSNSSNINKINAEIGLVNTVLENV